jgi:hypothetical protein
MFPNYSIKKLIIFEVIVNQLFIITEVNNEESVTEIETDFNPKESFATIMLL